MILTIIGYVLMLFVSFHSTVVANAFTMQGNELNPTVILFQALQHMGRAPFSLGGLFSNAQNFWVPLGVFHFIFLITAAVMITDAQTREHANSKTAKGSAEFSQDFKAFERQYTLKKPNGCPDAPDPNIILGKQLHYGLKRGRNTNVVIIGSAGSGKSFGVIKPNVMQMNSSFVVTDPSGELFEAEAKLLLENGYDVKIFSTSDMAHSNCYNPFDYVYDEDGEIDETRVSTMINMFMQNASDEQGNKGDKFWDQSTRALLNACAMYILEYEPEENHNMYRMLQLVQMGKVSEKDSEGQTELDKLFSFPAKEEAAGKSPHCLSHYRTFKLAPARTANSILISAAVDLNMFNQTKVRNMTTTSYLVKSRNTKGQIRSYHRDKNGRLIRTDENIDLRTIGDKKTCLFVNIPQADSTYNFLVSMLYAQLFESLYGRAEKICPNKWLVVDKSKQPIASMIDSKEDAEELIRLYKSATVIKRVENFKENYYIYNRDADPRFCIPGLGRGRLRKVYSKEVGEALIQKFHSCKIEKGKKILPYHVQCLLDEFSNIGAIPEYPQKLATMRKYEISCMIVLQSLSQLKNRYDKLWADILSNCAVVIFLGSQDPETCKYISQDLLGKTTIRVRNTSLSDSGKGKSSSRSYNLDARDLMTQDEVAKLNPNYCIIVVAGVPFKVPKYRASDHPFWEKTGDHDPNMRMEPRELVLCREKSSCKEIDRKNDIKSVVNAANGLNRNGKKAVSTPQQVSTAHEATQAAGIKKTNVKPVRDLSSLSNGSEDDWKEAGVEIADDNNDFFTDAS